MKYFYVLSQQELMFRQSPADAAMDPFLSRINEQHARQESADSGLGLGSAYSLPHTPEDFLDIDDNMDVASGKIVKSCRKYNVFQPLITRAGHLQQKSCVITAGHTIKTHTINTQNNIIK